MFNEVYEAAKIHAKAEYPKESVGLVVGNVYIPCENVASNPEQDFKVSSAVTDPYIIAGTLQAVIHSHPKDKLSAISCPSKADMESQVMFAIPFGIIDLDTDTCNDPYWWGDFTLDEDLLGSTFHHGIRDCYSLIRKYYWQVRQIKIPEFPRDDRWWMATDDLYINGFSSAGFSKISKEELKNGDVMLGKVNSNKINHAGVWLDNPKDGNGLVLHHLYGRLSRREAGSSWANRAEIFLRYTGAA